MVCDTSFFSRDVASVSRDLLGKKFSRKNDYGTVEGIVVDVEAYGDETDLASHARFGKTKRSRIMYRNPGTIYIYLIYGIYNIFNIICGKEGKPSGVMFRSIDITRGKEIAQNNLEKNRFTKNREPLAHGPGKLCVAFDITSKLNGQNISETDEICLFEGSSVDPSDIIKTRRVGVDYAKESKDKKWRFYIKNNS